MNENQVTRFYGPRCMLISTSLLLNTLTVDFSTFLCVVGYAGDTGSVGDTGRVARFLAAKYGRLLSIRDVRQGQYEAISCVCVCLFRSIVTLAVSMAVCETFSAKEWCDLDNRVRVR